MPTFLLARQNFSNGSLPNLPVDVVATNDGLYSVGAYQADYFDLVMLNLLYLHASIDLGQLMIVGMVIGGLPVRMLSPWSHLVTPMQEHRSTTVFSAKSSFSSVCESFLPRKFPAIL